MHAGTFYKDREDYLYYLYDYDVNDGSVCLEPMDDNIIESSFFEHMHVFQNCYDMVPVEEARKFHEMRADWMTYGDLLEEWELIDMPEEDKIMLLLGKAP